MAKRRFHWDPVDDCVMHETDENGDTIVEYTREPGPFGPLLSENRGGAESYHHYDALGSTTFLTDAAGDVTDTFAYDAWGNQVARTGATPTPYTWVGRWGYQDDTATTGGYYVRARTYQPTVARWMSVDPLWPWTRDSHFGYSGLRPVLMVDASGLEWLPQDGTSTSQVWCTPDVDSLHSLAQLVSGNMDDWVCIWPLGDEHPNWSAYPNALPCACADVSNLLATDGPKVGMIPKYSGETDFYLKALRLVALASGWVMRWTSGTDAATRLKNRSGEGQTPIKRLFVGGHGARNNVRICKQDGTKCFQASDLFRVATATDNASNNFSTASLKKGPPRCWFTRNAEIYGGACFSATAWTGDWESQIARPGVIVYGYEKLFFGNFDPNAQRGQRASMWFEDYRNDIYYNLDEFMASDHWK